MNATVAVLLLRLVSLAQGDKAEMAVAVTAFYEMKVHGKNILYFPFPDVAEFQKRPSLCGIPSLAPWADLLSVQAFWANGKEYVFNMELGNVRGAMPSSGLLVTSPLWRVTRVAADARSAYFSSRLETFDEHIDHPAQLRSEARAPWHGRWRIHGTGLPDEVLRKVYYINALRYLAARATVERELAARR